MIINPILPIWLMAVCCAALLALKRKGILAYIRQIVIVLLLFLINLRPMFPGEKVLQPAIDVNVTFVIDDTISMLAEDQQGEETRLDAVKKDCNYIMEQLPGASFRVITFAESVRQLTPYTVDVTMVRDSIATLNGQTRLYATGTHLNDIMSDLRKSLADDRTAYKVLFFISDGEITDDRRLQNSGQKRKYADAGAVLGYGTEEGGPMKAIYYKGQEDEPEYLTVYDENYNEKRAISKIDEKNLKQIASEFELDYVHMTKQSELDPLLKKIRKEAEERPLIEGLNPRTGYKDIYFLFAIPLVLLLIWDCICLKRKI